MIWEKIWSVSPHSAEEYIVDDMEARKAHIHNTREVGREKGGKRGTNNPAQIGQPGREVDIYLPNGHCPLAVYCLGIASVVHLQIISWGHSAWGGGIGPLV